MIKIGMTSHEDVKTRMAQIYTTGGPLPFECEYAVRVSNCERVEKALHVAFGPDRVSPKREFVEIDAAQAIAIIKLMEIEDVTPQVARQKEEVDANGEIVTVLDERMVNFRGETTLLTNATRVILDNGYHVAPGPYWTFNGEKLRDIYIQTYSEFLQ